MFSKIKWWAEDIVEFWKQAWLPLIAAILVGACILSVVMLVFNMSALHKTITCTWNVSHTISTCVEEWK